MQMNFQRFYRAPLPALLALFVVFVWQGMGHTVMILMEHLFGQRWVYPIALLIGAIGVWMVWFGKFRQELGATIWGFAGGSLIWTAWIEFSFHYYARRLHIQPLIEHGEIVTKQEYLLLPSSIGVLLATLVFFFFNKETRCNAFRWLHRKTGMNPGETSSGAKRDFSSIVAMETIFVTWFFYIYLLVLYDPQLGGGDRSTAAYVSLGLYITWTAFLANRLLRFQRMAPAIRYAIPTGIIGWTAVEIMGRWDLFTSFWERPEQYGREMAIVGVALLAALVLSMLSPPRQINVEKDEKARSKPAPRTAASNPQG